MQITVEIIHHDNNLFFDLVIIEPLTGLIGSGDMPAIIEHLKKYRKLQAELGNTVIVKGEPEHDRF